MFVAILNRSLELGFNLDPSTVSVDFELAAMKAVTSVFGSHVKIQGCFYHLTQNTWRKIQELGQAQTYRSEDDVKLCGMMDALTFLPLSQVKTGMEYLQSVCPDDPEDLLAYIKTI